MSLHEDLAREIASTFIEVLAAPFFSPEARDILKAKENLRLLQITGFVSKEAIRTIDGGALIQVTPVQREEWQVVSDRDPTADEEIAMMLAMKVCKHVKSNAIVFADKNRALGIGAGQMSRVDSAKIAISKAQFPLSGSVVASDAFLPFSDTLEVAAEAGSLLPLFSQVVLSGITRLLMKRTVGKWLWSLPESGISGTDQRKMNNKTIHVLGS